MDKFQECREWVNSETLETTIIRMDKLDPITNQEDLTDNNSIMVDKCSTNQELQWEPEE
jgi:hypothetical protein